MSSPSAIALMELNESGTIEAKEMIEIVGNLCELEGVAKVQVLLIKMEKKATNILVYQCFDWDIFGYFEDSEKFN